MDDDEDAFLYGDGGGEGDVKPVVSNIQQQQQQQATTAGGRGGAGGGDEYDELDDVYGGGGGSASTKKEEGQGVVAGGGGGGGAGNGAATAIQETIPSMPVAASTNTGSNGATTAAAAAAATADSDSDLTEENMDSDDDDDIDIVMNASSVPTGGARSVDFRQLAAAPTSTSTASGTAPDAASAGPPPNMIVAGFGMTSANVRGPAAAPSASSSSFKRISSSTSTAIGGAGATQGQGTQQQQQQQQPALSLAAPLDQPPPKEEPSSTSSSALENGTASAAQDASTSAGAAVNGAGIGGTVQQQHPASDLPIARAPGPEVDLSAPPLLADGSNTSIYDVDIHTLEASGQPWRRPGSDLSRWFNYGFDEVSWGRYVGFRKAMMQGREAMVSDFRVFSPTRGLRFLSVLSCLAFWLSSFRLRYGSPGIFKTTLLGL